MQAARLRLINEVHHRVISFNEEKGYPDEKFVRSILEPPGDLELQRQLREAFDLMVQVFASVSKVGAAPPPEVVVHCVHGTFPRGWWRQRALECRLPVPLVMRLGQALHSRLSTSEKAILVRTRFGLGEGCA